MRAARSIEPSHARNCRLPHTQAGKCICRASRHTHTDHPAVLTLLVLCATSRSGPHRFAGSSSDAGTIEDVLPLIARKIATGGAAALTLPESLLWNTAVVLSSMAIDRECQVPSEAKIFSWAAARAGFIEMGSPAAADIVSSLVAELAYRSEAEALDKAANDASLLRLADLKERFMAIDRAMDLWGALACLVDRARA